MRLLRFSALFVFAFGFASWAGAQTTTYFLEEFDDNSAGWVLGAEWQIGEAVNTGTSGIGFPDPSYDADGVGGTEGIAGVVIGGFVSTALHPFEYLTSPLINTAGAASLYLEFDRWLNSDYTPYMNNSVEVFDGTAWVTLWTSGPAPGISDNTWTHRVFNITPYSNSNLRVRFGQTVGSGGAFSIGSWSLDNVRIATHPTAYFKEDFNNDDAGWTLGTEWQIGAAAASAPGGSCGLGDPSYDADGPGGNNGIAGVNIGGFAVAPAIHPYDYLTSPPINTVGATTLILEFDRWLSSDYTPSMTNRVEVYDGASWVVL